jgi:tRNA (cytidine/uridine-2'-O-)-methyltransferase
LIDLVLYQPSIPQNTGAIMRLCVCLNIQLEIIEPCGFIWDDKRIKRASMDYAEHLKVKRHSSWLKFAAERNHTSRLILFSTKAEKFYHQFSFLPTDQILFGNEDSGVPKEVHEAATHCLRIPISPIHRSLNLAQAAAIAATEALRQLNTWPSN